MEEIFCLLLLLIWRINMKVIFQTNCYLCGWYTQHKTRADMRRFKVSSCPKCGSGHTIEKFPHWICCGEIVGREKGDSCIWCDATVPHDIN